jgi:hypothetical protein
VAWLSARSGLDEPAPDGVASVRDPVLELQLVQQVGVVSLDRVLADVQYRSDLPAAEVFARG